MVLALKPAIVPTEIWDQISPAERVARENLAALYRFMALQGWGDHIYTHITVRAPDADDQMLANPLGFRFNEITASSLLKIDMDGTKVLDSAYPPNAAVAVIHGGVYENIPEARCIVHLHTADGTAVSMQKDGLLPLSQSAMALGPIAYHDFEGIATDKDECARIAADFQGAKVMILRNHGTLTWGRSIPEAFNLCYQLERACTYQIAAMSGGAPLHIPAQQAIDQTAAFVARDADPDRRMNALGWDSVVREVERHDPGFRD